MTAFATQPDTDRHRAELAARTRVAWSDYRTALADLAGREYEDMEAACWDQLQATLRELEAEQARPPATSGPT